MNLLERNVRLAPRFANFVAVVVNMMNPLITKKALQTFVWVGERSSPPR